MTQRPTKNQLSALAWLRDHGGSGALSRMRGKVQYLVAGGETAPYMPSTWTALERHGLVRRADGRVTVVEG